MALIEREAVFGELHKESMKSFRENDKASCLVWHKAIGILNDAPTVDATPVVHGRWICHSDPNRMALVCSACGQVMPFVPEYLPGEPPYCNCGARMDLEEG